MPTRTPIRVRLAPSPTGDVHIGSIWLAQFDWLLAHQTGGAFVLRVEDTDQKRFVPGSIEKVYEALDWYGLTPDEGPKQGGPYQPYIQSERLPLYRQAADQLLASGDAYVCFCASERLAALRLQQEAAKQPPRYDRHCADLQPDEVTKRVSAGEPHVVRIRMPRTGTVTLHDVIRGDVTFAYDTIDDSVLLKADGFPTYHLAVVVDDHAMGITHVIRGEEWLPSSPKHLRLYDAFKWPIPQFAHMPLILGPDHRKLSKREGATSALAFRDEGYLPQAVLNFIALMGWHPKGEIETLTRQDLLEHFRLEEVNPSGAIFDRQKLDWFNGWYIRQLPAEDLRQHLSPFLTPALRALPDDTMHQGIGLIRERMKKLNEVGELLAWLPPEEWRNIVRHYDIQTVVPKKGDTNTTGKLLNESMSWLSTQPTPWRAAELKSAMLAWIASKDYKNGEVLWPLRVALTLQVASPDVFDVLAVLGPQESIDRIKIMTERLG